METNLEKAGREYREAEAARAAAAAREDALHTELTTAQHELSAAEQRLGAARAALMHAAKEG
jgi:chromosome segregation ATPase